MNPVLSLTSAEWMLLCGAVALIALLYSSVGHGGATGYLAVMALLGIGPAVSKPGALWMNCLVAGIAFWRFRRAGYFNWRVFGWLAAASVPMAWLGSRLDFHPAYASVVLGVALAVAGWLLGWGPVGRAAPSETPAALQPASSPGPLLLQVRELLPVRTSDGDGPQLAITGLQTATMPASNPMASSSTYPPGLVALPVGASLGFLAGITGIGGGVFLTPLLIFFRWTPAKVAGGISALFILVNSVAGLVGMGGNTLSGGKWMVLPVLCGLAGALIGSGLGVRRWSPPIFQKALAIVLWIAAVKLMVTHS